jgi:hypothetical protein
VGESRRDGARHDGVLFDSIWLPEDAGRTVCKDWRTLLNADAAHGRRVLRDLRIERVIVRRDDDGIWSYQLRGALDKLIGGRFFEVSNQVGATWEIEVEVPDS